jgi:PmbA protein
MSTVRSREQHRRLQETAARALARLAQASASGDVVLVESTSHEVRVRGEEIDFVVQARERALGIRALLASGDGTRCATTSTSDLEPEAVDRMVDETLALAHATAPDRSAGLPEGGFAEDVPDLGLHAEGDLDVTVEARIEDARRAERAARAVDPRITNSEGSQASSDFAAIVYGNTAGFLGSYQTASHGLYAEPLAEADGSKQRDYWMTASRRLDALEDPASVGRRAALRALRKLGARPVKTCHVPVVFDELCARGLLAQLAGLVSGYAVYRHQSCWADRLGEQVASELVTVVDDGRVPGGLGSKPFDGEGLPTRRKCVIERGRLETWLLDTYSGRKLGMASTGNASRGVGSGPGVGSTNLWIEPGADTLDEIIAATERGLLVTELMGMGFNPVTGDYSRGAAGLWIEGGEIAYPVEEITIAGNVNEMLRGIDRVGSELLWLGSVASPALRIERMTVAGE